MLVQVSKRPELAVVGMKCKVLMPTNWIGPTNDGRIIDCPAVITEVVKRDGEVTSISVDLRRSPKHNNCSLKNMLILAKQFEDVFVDVEIEKVKEIKEDNNVTVITKAV